MQRDDQLRSLERKRMETIFAPLDPNEALPRELLQERPTGGALFLGLVGGRYGRLGRRELAGALWLPALVAVLFLAGWSNVGATMTLGMIGLLLLGLIVFAISGERRAHLK
jgi:hypothetical protein